jgi:phosphoglycerate dehydrogenase-like enzyme
MAVRALYLLNPDAYDDIYGPDERADIARLVEVIAPAQTAQSVRMNPSILADVDVILTGWGMAVLDETLLAAAPALKAIFYGAGSIRYFVTDAMWARGIVVTSAAAANAVPVAEFTVAALVMSLKQVWRLQHDVRTQRRFVAHTSVIGVYRSTVGLIGLGMIGRMVAERLRSYDMHVLAYDPHVAASDAATLGVELCTLDALFARCDAVSLHAPWLSATEGMITGAHLATMRENAAFINTARGALVREAEMIDVLQQRPDLCAVLDVTYPEPPAPDSPLYTLPNVVLTPHIAGSVGAECQRMGRAMVDELARFVRGEPLHWSVSHTQAAIMA